MSAIEIPDETLAKINAECDRLFAAECAQYAARLTEIERLNTERRAAYDASVADATVLFRRFHPGARPGREDTPAPFVPIEMTTPKPVRATAQEWVLRQLDPRLTQSAMELARLRIGETLADPKKRQALIDLVGAEVADRLLAATN